MLHRHMLRRRRSFNKSVKFTNLPREENQAEKDKIPPAERIGNVVRFGNTIFKIREQKEDSIYCTALEVFAVMVVCALLYISYYHYETMHFHVAKGYGHLGYASAQHVVGQRLLTGRGADKNGTEAMRWFKYAADQGHPEAAFNLAVGHIHGEKTGLRPGGQPYYAFMRSSMLALKLAVMAGEASLLVVQRVLQARQPTKLLKHAIKHGVEGADHALNLCARRRCDV